MSKAGRSLIESLTEAVEVAKGDRPAARIHINGHTYVPDDKALRTKLIREIAAEVDRLKLTQDEIGRLLGVSQITVSRLLRGGTKYTVDHLEVFRRILRDS
jgi:predicted XRE-type DNA-binding protein